jgi:hypothetical protein
MKALSTNLKNTLVVIGTLVLTNTCIAKTYVATSSGKWNNPTIWEGEQPTKSINSDDVVIIKNHVLIGEDLNINGLLIIEKNSSFISSRSLAVSSNGQLVNNGSLSVRRMINEGKVENYGSFETMSELQNNGNINNDQNIIAGSSILNQAGRLEGNNGTYFANTNVITSKDASYSENVNIFYGGELPTNTSSRDFNVDIETLDNNVTLTIQNISNKKVLRYEVSKSTDGENYTALATNQNMKTDLLIFHDNDLSQPTVHYKVAAITASNEKIEIPTTSVSLGNSTFSMR